MGLRAFFFDRSEGPRRELLSRSRPHRRLVDLQPEPGAFGQRDVSIDRLEQVRAQALADLLERRKYSVMMKLGMQAAACTVADSDSVVEL
jgi:hypothetical protein